VRRVVARVRRRLARLGVIVAPDADGEVDPLADESGALAGLALTCPPSSAAYDESPWPCAYSVGVRSSSEPCGRTSL